MPISLLSGIAAPATHRGARALATYLLSYITIFFNVALVCAADDRMTGGDPTVSSAISDAWRHAAAITPWALVSVIVSFVLRAIEERAGILGRIAAGLLGIAWALITFLAVLLALPPLLLVGGGGQPELVVLAVALGLAWVMVVAVVMGALNMVFRVSLYRYAADGEAPAGFEDLDLGHVFPPKRRRGIFGRSA